jgi:hypothetical protein
MKKVTRYIKDDNCKAYCSSWVILWLDR